MKLIFKFLYISTILLIFTHRANAQDEEMQVYTRLDSLLDDMEANLTNTYGLYFCEELIKESQKDIYSPETQKEYGDYAKNLKINIYLSLSMHQRAIEYIDSLSETVPEEERYVLEFSKAITYCEIGQYQSSIQIAQKLYDNSKEIQDKNLAIQTRSNALSCLALANSLMNKTQKSLEYYNECIEVLTEDKDLVTERIPSIFEVATYRMQAAQNLENKDEALSYTNEYKQILDEYEEPAIAYGFSIPFSTYHFYMYNSLADIYCDLNDIKNAKYNIEQAEEILESEGMTGQFSALLYDVKAKYYNLIGDYTKAIEVADKAATFYHDTKRLNEEVNTLKYKLIALHKAKLNEQIFDIAMRRDSIKDLLNEKSLTSQLNDVQTIMEVQGLKDNARELENEKLRIEKQRQSWTFIAILALFTAIIGFFIMKRKRDKERQKILNAQKQLLEEEVERQTHELREQKDIIEQKNRDITDSINYAQRIQKSILPEFKDFGNGIIEGAFAFFIPCNIVSGDFYWASQQNNRLYFACADCTGHGVPGAFMSMIGTTILNEICKQQNDVSPSQILEKLHINLLSILQQSGEADSRDGMDISIIEYDADAHKVRVSAARRPICLFINSELVEYKAAKRSIGERDYTQETLPFTEEEYEVKQGDTIYLFSDGFPDQFGGPTENGKRLKHGGMVKMLMQLNELQFGLQHDEIERMYFSWRGNCPQYDDISLLGIRF